MFVPGTVLLWAAFLLGLVSTFAYWRAIAQRERWLSLGRQTFILMTVAVVLASSALMYLILTHDYRVAYVWSYSDSTLPLSYLVSTFWAGQEGSFLLWVLCSVLLGLPLMRYSRFYETRAMLFYNLTILALLMLLLRQGPFRFHEGLQPGMVPPDGQGLNPLLQNPWMVIHPPAMFLGYASLAVPFAFALAAVWTRRWDEWTRASLPWVLVSLATLGAAIMMGGYWAYETLGWGGYWAWDPVENASLVPWIATVALAHGMLLQRGRDRFRRLNLVLAVAAFLLVLYATFLTRSGVLADFSVHSFVDLGISAWLVFIMLFFLLLSAGMLAWRWFQVPAEAGSEPFVSRTIFLVLGIELLILIAFIVGVGTSSPIITRIWGEAQQVGAEFYNRVGVMLTIPLALTLAIVPFLSWSRASQGAARRFAGALGITAVLLVVAFLVGFRMPHDAGLGAWLLRAPGPEPTFLVRGADWILGTAYLATALFAIVTNLWAAIEKAATRRLRFAGGPIAHLGMGLMLVAFATTGWVDRAAKVRLAEDTTQEVLGYSLTFRGVELDARQRSDMVVDVTTPSGGESTLRPKMWRNPKSGQLVANPGILNGLTTDLYLAPVEYEQGTSHGHAGPRLELPRDETVAHGELGFVFRRFDLSRQGSVQGAMAVGVVVELQQPGAEPVELEPLFVIRDGEPSCEPVPIPGSGGGSVSVPAIDVDNARVWLDLHGFAGATAAAASLHQGEELAYKEYRITFDGFDRSRFEPDAGEVDFGVVLQVSRNQGEPVAVVPRYRIDSEGHVHMTPAEIPESGGLRLDIGRIDPEQGTVQVGLHDPGLEAPRGEPASVVMDVATKPLISLVWLGTLLTILGTVMALVLRRRDVASVEAAEVQAG